MISLPGPIGNPAVPVVPVPDAVSEAQAPELTYVLSLQGYKSKSA
jgi:hypothetical protein